MSLEASELILNKDGSIYHLGLLPEEIASTIITVGDPARVPKISTHFDTIEVKKQKREFCTHTGTYKGKRISVMSTGMGTDNIDIALNELDALVNIDLKARTLKDKVTSLDIIRIGTTGSLRKEIPVGSYILSELAIGFDGLMHYYEDDSFLNNEIAEAFVEQTGWPTKRAFPYVVEGARKLIEKLHSDIIVQGMTGTNVGFYGPQGRILRANVSDSEMNDKITAFSYDRVKVTNLEMETSGIYGISKLLGHNAASMNLVLANREIGDFLENASEMMEKLIIYTLNKIAE